MRSSLAVSFDERTVDAIFAPFDQCRLPGVGAGIAIQGRPVYRRGFGLANAELPLALSPTTRMRIASITKHFTALAYLLLCEEGRANLDDEVGRYLGELRPLVRRLTWRQLMGHIGGLRDAFDICWQFSGVGPAVTSSELLEFYTEIDDVDAEPGAAWIYNSGGYLLLTFAIERITGKPLEDVLRERIFERVGMHDTLLRRWDTDFVSNSAALHALDAAGNFVKGSLGAAMSGEAGMVSTIDDLLRWLAHMDQPVIGSAQSWQTLTTSQTLANGTPTGYGLGLVIADYRGVQTISHIGGALGGSAQLLKVPAAGLDIIVLSNRQDLLAMPLAYQVVDACLPHSLSVLPEADAGVATGTFVSGETGRVVQLFEKDGRQAAAIDGHEWPCVRHESTLRSLPIWNYLKHSAQLIGDSRQPHALRFNDFGNVDDLSCVGPSADDQSESIVGAYRCPAADVSVRISKVTGGNRMQTRGRFGTATYELECVAERIWRAFPSKSAPWWGGMLSFDASSAGFRFTSDRTRRLPFRRVGTAG